MPPLHASALPHFIWACAFSAWALLLEIVTVRKLSLDKCDIKQTTARSNKVICSSLFPSTDLFLQFSRRIPGSLICMCVLPENGKSSAVHIRTGLLKPNLPKTLLDAACALWSWGQKPSLKNRSYINSRSSQSVISFCQSICKILEGAS